MSEYRKQKNVSAGQSIAVTQGTATNLKAQAEVYQGGTAVSSSAPLQVTLANTGANATAVKALSLLGVG